MRIEETVAHIKALKTNAFDFELIIVDNNSSDNTFELASRMANTPGNRYIQALREPASGKSNALIAGIREAAFKYMVVCDDDNWLHEDYLLHAWNVLQGDQEIGILGGRGVIHTTGVPPTWFPILQNAWAVGSQATQSGPVTNEPKAVWGAGMVIRKVAWDAVFASGFSNFLTGRKMDNVAMAGEDTELCMLVHSIGYAIHYEEKMWYFHNLPQSRLTWKSLKRLWEGFARSSVYFEMYTYYFSSRSQLFNMDAKRKWTLELRENCRSFLRSSSPVNFLKIMYIAFVEDRPGYLPGLEKRKFLYRLKELWRIRKSYENSIIKISSFDRVPKKFTTTSITSGGGEKIGSVSS